MLSLQKFFTIITTVTTIMLVSEINNETFAKGAEEYQVKAACIIKITDFITWPEDSFSDNNNNFIIGVLGENKFKSIFEGIRKKIQGKNIKVKYFQNVNEIKQAQILFISPSKQHSLSNIFNKLKNKSILTIGDIPGFAKRGCIINLINKEGYVSFEINIIAQKRARLKISSDLLSIATIVESEE